MHDKCDLFEFNFDNLVKCSRQFNGYNIKQASSRNSCHRIKSIKEANKSVQQ